MDEIDSQILCALIVDSRASVTELSELVGKSHSATRQRLHKLSTDGTIEKFTIEVNPEVLGLAVVPQQTHQMLLTTWTTISPRR